MTGRVSSAVVDRAEEGIDPAPPVLSARGLTKRFPGVLAVDRFDLAMRPGEIVALLGQNGAGKSTVIKILAGVYPYGSYEGDISIGEQRFQPSSVAEAETAGVALVPQEVQVAPDLTVAESMYLHAEPTRFGLIDVAGRHAEAGRVLRRFDLTIDPRTPMGTLDLATQQLVIIARALSKNARLLILDEPTAALTDDEAQRLFAQMRALRAHGVAILFVSHRLAEVFAIADRIVVMRDGRLRGAHRTAETSRDMIVEEMVGETLADAARPAVPAASAEMALAVRDLTVADADPRRRPLVQGLSFAVAKGEILGLFGLLGAGCNEAALAVFGAWEGPVEGRRFVWGREITVRRPGDAIRHGIGLMAQDRRDTLLPDHSIAENIALASLPAVTRHGFLDLALLRRRAVDYLGLLRIKAPSVDVSVGTLSGGNQQKVQIARWLASGANVLLLVDPTRGVDVGARAEINAVWLDLARQGCALVLASSEAAELAGLCRRVLVLREGRPAGELVGNDVTEAGLLRMAAGVL